MTFINVLEHIPDPLGAMRKARVFLRPGGRIFIRTPNANFHVLTRSLIARGYLFWKGIKQFDHFVMHAFSFPPETLKTVLSKAGFGVPTVSYSPSATGGDGGSIFKRVVKSHAFYRSIMTMSFGRFHFCSSLLATAVNCGETKDE